MDHFLEAYLELMSNPAHLAVEGTFFLLIDIILLGIFVPLFKRMVRREHAKIDLEHNVDHPEGT